MQGEDPDPVTDFRYDDSGDNGGVPAAGQAGGATA